MDVKEAVRKAKEYIADLYAGENIRHAGLEEVIFDETENAWKVTIGFFRPLAGTEESLVEKMERLSQPSPYPGWKQRSFKVVHIDDRTGAAVSMTHRTFASA